VHPSKHPALPGVIVDFLAGRPHVIQRDGRHTCCGIQLANGKPGCMSRSTLAFADYRANRLRARPALLNFHRDAWPQGIAVWSAHCQIPRICRSCRGSSEKDSPPLALRLRRVKHRTVVTKSATGSLGLAPFILATVGAI